MIHAENALSVARVFAAKNKTNKMMTLMVEYKTGDTGQTSVYTQFEIGFPIAGDCTAM